MSKSALELLTRSWAVELAARGIREVARLAHLLERRSRQALRRALTAALREANRRGRHSADQSTVDIPPVRHRHGARRHAW